MIQQSGFPVGKILQGPNLRTHGRAFILSLLVLVQVTVPACGSFSTRSAVSSATQSLVGSIDAGQVNTLFDNAQALFNDEAKLHAAKSLKLSDIFSSKTIVAGMNYSIGGVKVNTDTMAKNLETAQLAMPYKTVGELLDAYPDTLRNMLKMSPAERLKTFLDMQRMINGGPASFGLWSWRDAWNTAERWAGAAANVALAVGTCAGAAIAATAASAATGGAAAPATVYLGYGACAVMVAAASVSVAGAGIHQWEANHPDEKPVISTVQDGGADSIPADPNAQIPTNPKDQIPADPNPSSTQPGTQQQPPPTQGGIQSLGSRPYPPTPTRIDQPS